MKRDATGSLADLYRYDLLCYGEPLVPKSKKYSNAEAEIGDNGVIWYNGVAYSSPSPAGSAVTGSSCPGWDFWHVFRDKRTGEYRPTGVLERFCLIHGFETLPDSWTVAMKALDPTIGDVTDVSDIEMVSLDELRNKLPQGFSS